MATIEQIIAAQEAAASQSEAQKRATAQAQAKAKKELAKKSASKITASEAEQSAFLAASTAGSELLQALGDFKRGRISKADADKKLKAFNSSLEALKSFNPSRAKAVEQSVLPPDIKEEPIVTTPTAPKIEMPMGAGAPKPAGKTPVERGAEALSKAGTLRTPPPKKKVKTTGETIFTEPMTISGQVSTSITGGDIFAQAQSMFGGIDEIFKTNEELKALITKAVTGKWEKPRFLSELENTNWFKTNAGPIRQRGFYKRQYDALVEAIKTDDPNYQSKIEELNRTSDYGRGLQNAVETVTDEWTSQYGTPTAEDLTTIKAIATELYQYANETDTTKIRNLVLAKPKRFSSTTILGGKSGENLAELKSIAAANGLDLEKDFNTSIQTWLDRIAKGESIETIKSLIRNTAKTTWGVNDKIAGLLDQGVDLSTIYSPFKTRMASLLEIAPETISFADLASKGVIGGKEEKNLYDFEKELRRDPRWQYTKNAREDMSSTALDLLRNFGFQG